MVNTGLCHFKHFKEQIPEEMEGFHSQRDQECICSPFQGFASHEAKQQCIDTPQNINRNPKGIRDVRDPLIRAFWKLSN